MNVFEIRNRLVADYSDYVQSFINIRDQRISESVHQALAAGLLWPEPLLQLNPSFEPGEWIDQLVDAGTLHEECRGAFRIKPEPVGDGNPT